MGTRATCIEAQKVGGWRQLLPFQSRLRLQHVSVTRWQDPENELNVVSYLGRPCVPSGQEP
jgi:hypothetical protein